MKQINALCEQSAKCFNVSAGAGIDFYEHLGPEI